MSSGQQSRRKKAQPSQNGKKRSDRAQRTARSTKGVLIGRLVGLTPDGHASVTIRGHASLERLVTARVLGEVPTASVGQPVAVMFEHGRPDHPVVLGPVLTHAVPSPTSPGTLDLELDGRRLILTGRDEIVLRCGPASITLTSDGRVAIRGVKVLSRSSGPNKIKGGSVQIN